MSSLWTHATKLMYPRLNFPSFQRRQVWSLLRRLGNSRQLATAPSNADTLLNSREDGSDRAGETSTTRPSETSTIPSTSTTSRVRFYPSSPSKNTIPSVRLLEHGMEMSQQKPPVTIKKSYAIIRSACPCPRCVDSSTTQRLFQTSDIPLNIIPRRVLQRGQLAKILWKNDVPGYDETHETVVDIGKTLHMAMMRLKYQRSTTSTRVYPTSICAWTRRSLDDNLHKIWLSYSDIMARKGKFLEFIDKIQTFGIAFLRGVPQSLDSVGAIANKLGGIRRTFYGETWDVKSVPEAANVAYTSQFLGFHMDLLYMNEPPGLQLLHCFVNTCKGGESLFSDSFCAAERLKMTSPRDFDLLTRFPVKFKYRNAGKAYRCFRPVIELDQFTGKIQNINWSPPFEGNFNTNVTREDHADDGSNADVAAFISAAKKFSDCLEAADLVFELKLEQGQCVIFNNRRIVHARRGFDEATGERWLRGAYVDTQDFHSTMQGSASFSPDKVTHVVRDGNSSYRTSSSNISLATLSPRRVSRTYSTFSRISNKSIDRANGLPQNNNRDDWIELPLPKSITEKLHASSNGWKEIPLFSKSKQDAHPEWLEILPSSQFKGNETTSSQFGRDMRQTKTGKISARDHPRRFHRPKVSGSARVEEQPSNPIRVSSTPREPKRETKSPISDQLQMTSTPVSHPIPPPEHRVENNSQPSRPPSVPTTNSMAFSQSTSQSWGGTLGHGDRVFSPTGRKLLRAGGFHEKDEEPWTEEEARERERLGLAEFEKRIFEKFRSNDTSEKVAGRGIDGYGGKGVAAVAGFMVS